MIFINKGSVVSEEQPNPQSSRYPSPQANHANSEIVHNHEIADATIIPISNSDITDINDSSTAQDIHQKLAITLITELELLNETKNRNTIRARLSSTANKFYLLKRAIQARQIDSVNFATLPPEYNQRIKALSEIWTNNPTLAHEADDIYSELDLLDSEHVPYLLRNWLISNTSSQTL